MAGPCPPDATSLPTPNGKEHCSHTPPARHDIRSLLPDRRSPTLLIAAVIAFAAGIILATTIPCRPVLLLPPLILLAIAVILTWKRTHWLQQPLLLFFFLFCGQLHGSVHLAPPTAPSHLFHLFAEEAEATLSGTLTKAPVVYPDKTKLFVAVDGIIRPPATTGRPATATDPIGAAARFIPATGIIELAMREPPAADLTPGVKLLARAHIARPQRYGTPGSFDYPAFLARESIYVTGWISSPALIRTITPAREGSSLHRLRFFPEELRHQINITLDRILPPHLSGLYKAILTGDRASIPPQTMERFTATGAVHLLAISGLHMGLVAAGTGWLINLLLRRSTWLLLHFSVWKVAALLTIPLLFSYALIAGFQTPVIRALLMTLVVLLAVVFDRQWHMPTTIAIAALLILIFQPAALFTVSFQLSFAAVIAIVTILPYLSNPTTDDDLPSRASPVVKTIAAATKNIILVSCAATAGTLPLLIWHFNRFSPLAAFSTLLLEPLLCFWALPIGLISCPLLFFAPQVAELLLHLGAVGLQTADVISTHLAALPFSSFWVPTPSWPEIIACYLLLASLLLLKKNRIALAGCFISLLILITVPITHHIAKTARPTDRVAVIDVGQGSAALISLTDNSHVLIDGGGAASERFNPGRNIIAPYLWHQRITRLEAVVVSHPDADHYNGLFFILERFRPRTLWINGAESPGQGYNALLDLAKLLGIAIRIPQENDVLHQTAEARLINLADYHLNGGTLSDNGRSLIIALESRGRRFLFPGDIDTETEKMLVQDKKRIAADVLVLPHHGSSSSSSAAFLAGVSPRYTLVSAGKSRRKTFPGADVLARCQQTGSTVLSTASDGTITFAMTEEEMTVTTFTAENGRP
ncbi:MAG: DNA internalization-related competence protein ComEC/Rec2 [Thermodesulfobacteriota bacterium]